MKCIFIRICALSLLFQVGCLVKNSTNKLSEFQKQFSLAENHIKDGDYQKSLNIFRELLSKDTANAELLFYVGYCYSHVNEEYIAFDYFVKALKYDYKDKGIIYYNIAVISFNGGGFSDAVRSLNKAIEVDSVNPMYYEFRGDNYLILKDTVCACYDYSMALLLGDTTVKDEIDLNCKSIDSLLIVTPCLTWRNSVNHD